MKIRPIVEQIKSGDKSSIEVLIDHYYPIFLEKAYKNKPDYYMPDRVKEDVTFMINNYFNKNFESKFTDYIKSALENYCNKNKKQFYPSFIPCTDPLAEVEKDDYYINIIYTKIIEPNTKILNKEDKIFISYMMYFNIKNTYYAGNIKTSFPTYIGNYIKHFSVNTAMFTIEDKIIAMYICLVGIENSLKDYCEKYYRKMCDKHDYTYKEKEFIEFINVTTVSDKKVTPILLTNRIETFVLVKKKEEYRHTKKESESQGNYEHAKTRIFNEYKNSGIDETLLLDYINFYYDRIVEDYNNKKDELRSDLRKCVTTKLKNGVKTLIVKDEESKKIIKDIIKDKNLSKTKIELIELARLSVLRNFYVSNDRKPSPKKLNDTLFEQTLYVIFSDDDTLKEEFNYEKN